MVCSAMTHLHGDPAQRASLITSSEEEDVQRVLEEEERFGREQ